jgi:hypothetical protein
MFVNLSSEQIGMATNAAIFGPAVAALNGITGGKSQFTDTSDKSMSITTVLIILLLIIIFIVMLLRAVYNLTGSGFQTCLCFFFTTFYLLFATMYYGLSGYKYKLANPSLNSRN